ncbi:MAG: Hsp20/alpha crystallin family protein [Bacteroidota bacterium]
MSANTQMKKWEPMPTFFDNFFRPWNDWFNSDVSWGKQLRVPAANVSENKDEYLVSIAAPGMKKEDFNIDVNGNMVTISCEKKEKKEENENNYTRREYNYSSFSRSFTLPDEVNKEKIDARYEDGLLKLSLPKKEEAKKMEISKHISVK